MITEKGRKQTMKAKEETESMMPDLKAAKLVEQVMQARSEHEKREKVERFRHLNRFVRKGQVVFAGSSLMEQFPIGEFAVDWDLPCKIYNRGVGGFTTQELLAVMGPCIYDLEPRAVFLNIGTNDLNDPDCTVAALMERYGEILRGIRAHLPQCRLFLLAYYPVNPQVSDLPYIRNVLKYRTNARIEEANTAVRGLAEEFGATYLDLNAPLRDETGCLKAEYTLEGIHMYADGYQALLPALLPVLRLV